MVAYPIVLGEVGIGDLEHHGVLSPPDVHQGLEYGTPGRLMSVRGGVYQCFDNTWRVPIKQRGDTNQNKEDTTQSMPQPIYVRDGCYTCATFELCSNA